jgi:cysteine dioxygenase type I/regulatory GntR family protein
MQSLGRIEAPQNLTALAYDSIKAYILREDLDDETRLTEELLSKRLGISKSHVREALNSLHTEGLIRTEATGLAVRLEGPHMPTNQGICHGNRGTTCARGQHHTEWAISWLPGQSTGFHDHGASSGAFVVATRILEEHRPGERTRVILPGKPRAFGRDYTHDVRNVSLAPAISIHAYSPPLDEMNEFELDGNRLVRRERASAKTETISGTRPIAPAISG